MSVATDTSFRGIAQGGPWAGAIVVHHERRLTLRRPFQPFDLDASKHPIEAVAIGAYDFIDGVWIWSKRP